MAVQRIRKYELVTVLSPETDEDEVAAALERVTSYITERGGNVLDQDNWGVRRLAYPIERFQEGNYTLTRFELDAKDVLELDRSLNASEGVLRHLLTLAAKPEK